VDGFFRDGRKPEAQEFLVLMILVCYTGLQQVSRLVVVWRTSLRNGGWLPAVSSRRTDTNLSTDCCREGKLQPTMHAVCLYSWHCHCRNCFTGRNLPKVCHF